MAPGKSFGRKAEDAHQLFFSEAMQTHAYTELLPWNKTSHFREGFQTQAGPMRGPGSEEMWVASCCPLVLVKDRLEMQNSSVLPK